jgi:hypothetical protein
MPANDPEPTVLNLEQARQEAAAQQAAVERVEWALARLLTAKPLTPTRDDKPARAGGKP